MSLRDLRQDPYPSEYGVIFFDDSLTAHVIEKIAQQSKDKYVTALVRQLDLTEQAKPSSIFSSTAALPSIRKSASGSKNWEASRDLISGLSNGLKRYIK